MRNQLAAILFVLVTMGGLSRISWSRQSASKKPGREHAPRLAPPIDSDGAERPDLSGVWNAASGLYQYAAFSKDEPPMTAWGQARFSSARPSQGAGKQFKLTETNDHVYKCQPPGVPYIYIQLFPMQIIQTPTEVIELFEYDHVVRYIYTDGRKHPSDLKPSYNGHSIGRWEGGTLVVDTVGFNGKNWLDRIGHPESDAMHIVEHIRRADEQTLQVKLLFDDPKSYTQPWSAQIGFRLHPDWDILEHICEDNLAFESFEK